MTPSVGSTNMPKRSQNVDGGAPTVSILASSYNHERWILDALESIRAQTFQDFELIYADDASSDRSVELATAWLRDRPFPVRTVIHRENRGVGSTFNEALALCRGRYLQIISCDDALLPEKFERQVAVLDAAPADVALVYSDWLKIDVNGNPVEARGLRPLPPPVFDFLVQQDAFAPITMLVKLDAVRAVGGFDARVRCEDWDLYLRLARSYGFAYSDYLSAAYRYVPTGQLTKVTESDRYWSLRKHADHSAARTALKWLVHRLYDSDTLPADLRADFLELTRSYPDTWNPRNSLMRLRVPPRACRSLIRLKQALSR